MSGGDDVAARPTFDFLHVCKIVVFSAFRRGTYTLLLGFALLLRFCASLFGLSGTATTRRVDLLLELAGLQGVATPIGGFSRGMKQRLGVAQAMINSPRLLILTSPPPRSTRWDATTCST